MKRDFIEKEEVKRILLATDIRSRALIAVLASSGLRVGVSALRLRLRHFLDDLSKDLPCYMLEIPEALTKREEIPQSPLSRARPGLEDQAGILSIHGG